MVYPENCTYHCKMTSEYRGRNRIGILVYQISQDQLDPRQRENMCQNYFHSVAMNQAYEFLYEGTLVQWYPMSDVMIS